MIWTLDHDLIQFSTKAGLVVRGTGHGTKGSMTLKPSISAPRALAVCFALCASALPAVCQGHPFASNDAQGPPTVQRIRNGVQLTTGDLTSA